MARAGQDRDTLTPIFMVVRIEDQFGMRIGTVVDLANALEDRSCGDRDIEVTSALALNAAGGLTEVGFTAVGGGDFDEDDWSPVRVTVRLPGGRVEEAFYKIDGRA